MSIKRIKMNWKKIVAVFSCMILVTGIFVGVHGINKVKAETAPEIGTANLNNTAENSAKVGVQLLHPEKGWQRYDDNDSRLIYTNLPLINDYDGVYSNGHTHWIYEAVNSSCKFSFRGTKLRIISYGGYINGVKNITIDGVSETYTQNFGGKYQWLVYEKIGLPDAVHTVTISCNDKSVFAIDNIDIDDTGYLIDPSAISATGISLNKSSLTLPVGQTDTLIATVTPENATNKTVKWSTTDKAIADIDINTGKVTAIKAGTATITATVEGTNLTATCTITVTEPSNDRAVLAITMTNGQIKEYDLSQKEIDSFVSWFDSSNGKGQTKFTFTKKISPYKDVKENLVFDKISSYEVRTYTATN